MMGERGGDDKRHGICARALQDIIREATRRKKNEVFTIQVNTAVPFRLTINSNKHVQVEPDVWPRASGKTWSLTSCTRVSGTNDLELEWH